MTKDEDEAINEAIFVLSVYRRGEYSRMSADRHIRVLTSIRDSLTKIDTPLLVKEDKLKRVI